MSERYISEDDFACFFHTCCEQVARIISNNGYKNNFVENNLDIDLLAMMFTVSDFTANSFNRRDIVMNDLIPYIFEDLPHYYAWWFSSITPEKFDERVDFYGKIIRKSIKLRAESITVDTSENLLENPLVRCVIAFCDILKNPKCINDYSNAPVALLGFSDDFLFTSEVTYPIIEFVMTYIKKIIDYCKTNSLKYPNIQKSLEYTNIQKTISTRTINTQTDNPYLISSLSYLIGFGILVVLAIIIGLITDSL